MFGGPRLHARDAAAEAATAASSMVMRRSFSEMNADNALSIVVLPEPVPPEMIVVMRLHLRQQLRHLRLDGAMSTSLFRL